MVVVIVRIESGVQMNPQQKVVEYVHPPLSVHQNHSRVNISGVYILQRCSSEIYEQILFLLSSR